MEERVGTLVRMAGGLRENEHKMREESGTPAASSQHSTAPPGRDTFRGLLFVSSLSKLHNHTFEDNHYISMHKFA